MNELTPGGIRNWFAGLDLTNRSRENYRRCFADILNYAKQQDYLSESPLDKLTPEETKPLFGNAESKQPGILSILKAEHLLEAARVEQEGFLLPAVVLKDRFAESGRLRLANLQADRSA